MKVAVRDESEEDANKTDQKASNALLRALNRRKAQNILDLNAASYKVPEVEPEVTHEILGLTEDQIEYKEQTK